jgi:hypothetical protein
MNKLDYSSGLRGPAPFENPKTLGRWSVKTQIANIKPIQAAPERSKRLRPMLKPAPTKPAPKNATQNLCYGIQGDTNVAMNDRPIK